MKVLIVHNDFRVYWKGRLLFLHEYLGKMHVDFYAIELFGKGSPYSFDTYENKENWWTCLFPDKSYDEIPNNTIRETFLNKLDEINPDIVIGSSIVFFAGALGIRWAKNNHKKFVMFDDAKPSQVKRSFLVRTIKNLIIHQVDGLWLPSADYDEAYKPLVPRYTLIFHGYNCIDNNLFRFKEKKEMHFTTVTCVARLVPIKNIDNLLRAWTIIEKKRPDYKLAIIGDGPEFVSLNELTLSLGLKTIVFLGAINNSDIPTYFYNSVAFVLPSLSESWGLVVNEAMAAGLPILISNKINAANALLQEGVNGYGYEPLDIENMAEKIMNFINLSVPEKIKMSDSSLEIINGMSYENMGDELLNAVYNLSHEKPAKVSGLARLIINIWHGRYNTAGWNKL
ncbi:MAG: glycosyltransferase family 4 protein [Bacteroidetes bacterium]|nr:glycosyltransferase family 4 protein [Bacteroidota bacterium]